VSDKPRLIQLPDGWWPDLPDGTWINRRLVQLPDGTRIDPDHVHFIAAFDGSSYYEEFVDPRVVVKMRNGYRHVINCTSFKDAEAERDRIAAIVNGADS
jgi:hypothetical protein